MDIKTRTKKIWCVENVYPSEPIFVPSPDAKVSHCIFAVIATCCCNSCLIWKYVQIFVSEWNFFIFRVPGRGWWSCIVSSGLGQGNGTGGRNPRAQRFYVAGAVSSNIHYARSSAQMLTWMVCQRCRHNIEAIIVSLRLEGLFMMK